MSYVGGPGYELYVPIEMTRHVSISPARAGADLGLRDAGYYALDALRVEQGRHAWGAELGPDETPWEAGLSFQVKLDRSTDFIGKQGTARRQGKPLRKKLVTLVLPDSPEPYAWGGEGHRRQWRDAGRNFVRWLESAGRRLRGAGLRCVRSGERPA